MTNGTLAGLMLARMLTRGAHPLQDVFDPRRIGFVPPATQTLREAGEAIKNFVGDRFVHSFATDVDLSPGQGEVIRHGTSFVAVSRDSEGTLHKVSAACTHLGCLVSWNQGDQTWDCPCHGSRFSCSGEVIEGPATTPLEPLT